MTGNRHEKRKKKSYSCHHSQFGAAKERKKQKLGTQAFIIQTLKLSVVMNSSDDYGFNITPHTLRLTYQMESRERERERERDVIRNLVDKRRRIATVSLLKGGSMVMVSVEKLHCDY